MLEQTYLELLFSQSQNSRETTCGITILISPLLQGDSSLKVKGCSKQELFKFSDVLAPSS
jgi:hypothetical protein